MDSPVGDSPALAGLAGLAASASVGPAKPSRRPSSCPSSSHAPLEEPTADPGVCEAVSWGRARSGLPPAAPSARSLPCTGANFAEGGEPCFSAGSRDQPLPYSSSLGISVLSSQRVTSSVLACLEELRSAHANGQWGSILSLRKELSAALLPSVSILKQERKRRDVPDACESTGQCTQDYVVANEEHENEAGQPPPCPSSQQFTPRGASQRPGRDFHSGKSDIGGFFPDVREDRSSAADRSRPLNSTAVKHYYSGLLCPSFSCPDFEAELFGVPPSGRTGGRTQNQLSKKSSSALHHIFTTRGRGGRGGTERAVKDGYTALRGGETENGCTSHSLKKISLVHRLTEEAALGLYEALVDASLHCGEIREAEKFLRDFLTGAAAPPLFPPSCRGPLPSPLRRWRQRRRERGERKPCAPTAGQTEGRPRATSEESANGHPAENACFPENPLEEGDRRGDGSDDDDVSLSQAFYLQPFLYAGQSTASSLGDSSVPSSAFARGRLFCDFPPLDVWLLWLRTLAGVSTFSDLQEALACAPITVIWALLGTSVFHHCNQSRCNDSHSLRVSRSPVRRFLSSFPGSFRGDTESTSPEFFRPLHLQLALLLSSSPSRFSSTDHLEISSNLAGPLSPSQRPQQYPSHSCLGVSDAGPRGNQTSASPLSPSSAGSSCSLYSPFFFFGGFRGLPLIRQLLVVEALAIMGLLCQRAALYETAVGLYELVFLLTSPVTLLVSKHRLPLLPTLAGGLLLSLQANLAPPTDDAMAGVESACRSSPERSLTWSCPSIPATSLFLLLLPAFLRPFWECVWPQHSSAPSCPSSPSPSLQAVLDFADVQWSVLLHSRLCRPLPSELTLSFFSSFLSNLTLSAAGAGPPTGTSGFLRGGATPADTARPSRSETCFDIASSPTRRHSQANVVPVPGDGPFGGHFSGYARTFGVAPPHGRSEGRSGSGLWGRKSSFVKHLQASRDFFLQGFGALLNADMSSEPHNRPGVTEHVSRATLSVPHLLYFQSHSRLTEHFLADGGLLRSLVLDPICPFSRDSLKGVGRLRRRLWLATLYLTVEPGGPLSSRTNRAIHLAGLTLEQKRQTLSQLRAALTTTKHATALLAGVPGDLFGAEHKGNAEETAHGAAAARRSGGRAMSLGGGGGFLRPSNLAGGASTVRDSVYSSFRRAFSRSFLQSSPHEEDPESPHKQTSSIGGQKEETRGSTCGDAPSDGHRQEADSAVARPVSGQLPRQESAPVCCSLEDVLYSHWRLADEPEESLWALALSGPGELKALHQRDGQHAGRPPGASAQAGSPLAAKIAQAASVRVYNESVRTSYVSSLFLRFLPACAMDPRHFLSFHVEQLKELDNYSPMPFKTRRLAVLLARWCTKAGRPTDAHGDPARVYASSLIHAVRRYETRLAAAKKNVERAASGVGGYADHASLAEAAHAAATAISSGLENLTQTESDRARGRRGNSSAPQVGAEGGGRVQSAGGAAIDGGGTDGTMLGTSKNRGASWPCSWPEHAEEEGGGARLCSGLLSFLLDTVELTAVSHLVFAGYSVRSGERLAALRLGEELNIPASTLGTGVGDVAELLESGLHPLRGAGAASLPTRAVVIKGGGGFPAEDGVYLHHLTELLEHTFLLSLSTKVNEPLLARLLERLAVSRCLQGDAVLSVAALEQRIERHTSMLRSFEDSRGGLRLMDAQSVRRLFDTRDLRFSRGFISSFKAHLLLVSLQRPFSAGLAATQGLHDLAREGQKRTAGVIAGTAQSSNTRKDGAGKAMSETPADGASKQGTSAAEVRCLGRPREMSEEEASTPTTHKDLPGASCATAGASQKSRGVVIPFATSLCLPCESVQEEHSALVLLLSLGEASLIQARQTRLFTVPPGLLPAPPVDSSSRDPTGECPLGPLDLLDNAESGQTHLRSGDERRVEVTTYPSLVNRAYRCGVSCLQLWSGATDYRVWALLAWTAMHAFDLPACAEFARRALLLDRRDARMWLVLAWCHSGRLPVDAPASQAFRPSSEQALFEPLRLRDARHQAGDDAESTQVSFADNGVASSESPGTEGDSPFPPLLDELESSLFSYLSHPASPPPFPAAPVLDPRYRDGSSGCSRAPVDAGLVAFCSVIGDGLEELPTSLALVLARTWTQARHSPQYCVFSSGETRVNLSERSPGDPAISATGALVGNVTGSAGHTCGTPREGTCGDGGGQAKDASWMSASPGAFPEPATEATLDLRGSEAASLDPGLSSTKLKTGAGEETSKPWKNSGAGLARKTVGFRSEGVEASRGDRRSGGSGESQQRDGVEEGGGLPRATTALSASEGGGVVLSNGTAEASGATFPEAGCSTGIFWLAEERRKLALDEAAAYASSALGLPCPALVPPGSSDALGMLLSDGDLTDASTDTEGHGSDTSDGAAAPSRQLETALSSVCHGGMEPLSASREDDTTSLPRAALCKKETKQCAGRSCGPDRRVKKARRKAARCFVAVEDTFRHLREFVSALENESQQRVNAPNWSRRETALCLRCRTASHLHLLPCAMHTLQKLSAELSDDPISSGRTGSSSNKSSLASGASGLQRASSSFATAGPATVGYPAPGGGVASGGGSKALSSSVSGGGGAPQQPWSPYCSPRAAAGASFPCACVLHDCPRQPVIESVLDSWQPSTPSQALRRKQALLRADLGFSADPYDAFYSGGGPHRTESGRSRGVALVDSRHLEREAVGWMVFAELLCHLGAPGAGVFTALRVAGLYLQALEGVCAASRRDSEREEASQTGKRRVPKKSGAEREKREEAKTRGENGGKQSGSSRAKTSVNKKKDKQEGRPRPRRDEKQPGGGADEMFACSRCGLLHSAEVDSGIFSSSVTRGGSTFCTGAPDGPYSHLWGCPLSRDSSSSDGAADLHAEGSQDIREGWRVAELLGVKLEFLRLYAEFFYIDCEEALARERLDTEVFSRLFREVAGPQPLHLPSAADCSGSEADHCEMLAHVGSREGCGSPEGGGTRLADPAGGHFLSSKASSLLVLNAHRSGGEARSPRGARRRRQRVSQEEEAFETGGLFNGIGSAALASATILSACPGLDSAGRARDPLCAVDGRMGLERLLERVRAFRRMHPFARPPQILEARILYRQRNVTAAAATLEDVVALDTGQMYLNSDTDFLQESVAVYIYGRCMQTLGQFERATKAFERATQLYFYAPMLACSLLSADQRRAGSVDELLGRRFGCDEVG